LLSPGAPGSPRRPPLPGEAPGSPRSAPLFDAPVGGGGGGGGAFPDEDTALEVGSGGFGAGDPLALTRPLASRPPLVAPGKPPPPSFPAWDALAPDGRGEALAQRAVREALSWEGPLEGAPARAALAAAEAVGAQWALEAAGRAPLGGGGGGEGGDGAAALTAWAAVAGGGGGGGGGSSASGPGGPLSWYAATYLREALAPALPCGLAGEGEGAAGAGGAPLAPSASPAALVGLALALVPAPQVLLPGGWAAPAPRGGGAGGRWALAGGGGFAGWESACRGALSPRAIADANALVDAADAFVLRAAAEEAVGDENAMAAARAARALPRPLLRAAPPLTCAAADVGVGGGRHEGAPAAATLRVTVAGLAFRDHPLFTREDAAASELKTAFAEWAAAMAGGTGRVAAADGRLGALLGDAAEFCGEALPALNARAGHVLELVSAWRDAVGGAAEAGARAWRRWEALAAARGGQGAPGATGLRLGVVEVPPEAPAPPLLHHLRAAEPLFAALREAAEAALEGGAAGAPPAAAAQARDLFALWEGEQRRVEEDWRARGVGWGCGVVGSGVAHVDALAAAAAAAGGGGGAGTGVGGEGAPLPAAEEEARARWPGARKFLLALSDDAPLRPPPAPGALKPPPDAARRAEAMARAKIAVALCINGEEVGRSPPARLNSAYCA
jgi:hypothetical protein